MTIIDLTYVNSYLANRLYTEDWSALSPQDRLRAMEMVNNALNALDWSGELTSAEQTNAWPRDSLPIPKPIKYAFSEECLAYAKGDTVDDLLEQANVRQDSYAKSQTTYIGRVPENLLNGIISGSAWHLIKPYLRDARSVRVNRVS
jgi:tRNA A37 N6-isopentenylltransferase MiaA